MYFIQFAGLARPGSEMLNFTCAEPYASLWKKRYTNTSFYSLLLSFN